MPGKRKSSRNRKLHNNATGRSVFGCRPLLLRPSHERMIDCQIQFRIWIISNFAQSSGWCMSAATTMPGTACCWMTAGSLASASRAFPDRWSANISGPQSCRWTGNWKQHCSTRGTANAAAGAGRCSGRAPTVGNTAPTAPLPFTASKRPRANVGAGPSVDNWGLETPRKYGVSERWSMRGCMIPLLHHYFFFWEVFLL